MSAIIKPHYGSAISGRERGLIVGYEMDACEGVLVNKEVTGLGGGSDGTIVGARQMRDPIHGNGLKFTRANGDYVSFTQTGDTQTAGAIEVTVRPWDLTGGPFYIFSGAGGPRYYIDFLGATLRTRLGDTAVQNTTYTGIVGKSVRIRALWAAGHVYIYADDVLVDDYASNFTGDMATPHIGCDQALGNNFDGEMFEFQLLRRQLSAVEVLTDYLEYAQRAKYKIDFDRFNVSPAPEGVGPLSNTLWQILAGTFRVVDAVLPGGQVSKAIRNVAAGRIAITRQHLGVSDIEAAYGTYGFAVDHAAGNTTDIYFSADGTNPAAINGYRLRIDGNEAVLLDEMTAGGATNLMTTANGTITAGQPTAFIIPRRDDGRFTVLIDGVPAVATVGTNPVTDNTHQVSDYVVGDMGIDDELLGLWMLFGEAL